MSEKEHTVKFNTCHMRDEVNRVSHTFVEPFGPLNVECEEITLTFKKVIGKKPDTVVVREKTGQTFKNVSKFCQ